MRNDTNGTEAQAQFACVWCLAPVCAAQAWLVGACAAQAQPLALACDTCAQDFTRGLATLAGVWDRRQAALDAAAVAGARLAAATGAAWRPCERCRYLCKPCLALCPACAAPVGC